MHHGWGGGASDWMTSSRYSLPPLPGVPAGNGGIVFVSSLSGDRPSLFLRTGPDGCNLPFHRLTSPSSRAQMVPSGADRSDGRGTAPLAGFIGSSVPLAIWYSSVCTGNPIVTAVSTDQVISPGPGCSMGVGLGRARRRGWLAGQPQGAGRSCDRVEDASGTPKPCQERPGRPN